jgi:peptidoglycan-binding protein ArfA
MADSGEAPKTTQRPETTQRPTAVKSYWRPFGLPWVIGLVVIPLLLGIIGYGVTHRTRPQANSPSSALTTLGPASSPDIRPSIAPVSLAPVSIVRSGKDITLRGDFPDAKAKWSHVDAVVASVGSGTNIIDYLGIKPDVSSLDFSGAGPVFNAAKSIPNFSLSVSGDTITLAGTSTSTNQADAVEQAAEDAWPNLNIVDRMEISGPVTPTGSPPTSTPVDADNDCANLKSDIKAFGPIIFATDAVTLTPAGVQTLTQVADKLKACPGANVTINGYADNTGNDAVNIPLSGQRANAVADFLIAQGVTRDQLTTKGLGSADPLAGNDTADGRAKNRRVEIVAG